jgi:hypothetical protein
MRRTSRRMSARLIPDLPGRSKSDRRPDGRSLTFSSADRRRQPDSFDNPSATRFVRRHRRFKACRQPHCAMNCASQSDTFGRI